MRERKTSRGPLVAALAFVVLLVGATVAVVLAPMAAATRTMALALLGLLGVVVGVFAQPLVGEWLSRRGPELPPEPDVRALVTSARSAGPSSQLGSMVALREVFAMRFRSMDFTFDAMDAPRLEVRGVSVSTDALASEWSKSPYRLVILGEAGYGKTTAALALLHAANSSSDDSVPLVELFALNEWYQYHLEHPDDSLGQWMSSELLRTYGLTMGNAHALIESGRLVPVLDGLDEVPVDGCVACIEAISAYSGKANPPKPFALTCRVDRYQLLAPKWIGYDRQVVVLGLDAEQVVKIIRGEKKNQTNWVKATTMLSQPGNRLEHIFASPLRLSIALQTYDSGDPTELASMSDREAKARLWELLLNDSRWAFEGKGSATIGGWLSWLARSMDSSGRQYFWPHELYIYAPERASTARKFRLRLGLWSEAIIIPSIVAFGIVTKNDARSILIVSAVVFFLFRFGRVVFAMTSVPMARKLFHLGSGDEPTRRVRVSWRTRFRDAPASLLIVPMAMALFGLGASLVGGLRSALPGALIGGVGGLIVAMFGPPVAPVEDQSTQPLKVVTSDFVLRESAFNGLRWGIAGALVTALVGGFCGLAASGLRLAALVAFAGALLGGVTALMSGGLDAWLYHRWLQRHMAEVGLTPRKIDDFLLWCAMPERQWIRRAGGSFQFRHRELQDHLSARPS